MSTQQQQEEEVKEWWGSRFCCSGGNTMTFFKASEKWVEENGEENYDEYGRLDDFIDNRKSEEEEEAQNEWSVRGYYHENCSEDIDVDDDYFKSFKTEEEARVFYNSITKEMCNAGKVLYKEPYEDDMILDEVFRWD